MNTNTDPGFLPRYDLREAAFRKYESDIACALKYPSFIKRPPNNMSTHTYVCRFRDAILGFKRYHYPSILIPPNPNFDVIDLIEHVDGTVHISNTEISQQAIVTSAPLTPEFDEVSIEALLRVLSTRGPDSPETPIPYYNKEQLAWLLSFNGYNAKGLGLDLVIHDQGNGFVHAS